MEGKQKGKLSVVAKTGGIKMVIQGVETSWINPTPEAKKNALDNIGKLKEHVGKEVEIVLNDETKWTTLNVVESDQEEETNQEIIAEEKVETEELKQLVKKVGKLEKKVVADKKKTDEEDIDIADIETTQAEDPKYFLKLSKVKGETKQIGSMGLNYMSWAEAWGQLKERYPDANYYVHESNNGMPYVADDTGAFVKVSVTVSCITHTVHLPVMDHTNKALKLHEINAFNINKSVQRALTKAIAMHGLGLYLYRGEDYPKE